MAKKIVASGKKNNVSKSTPKSNESKRDTVSRYEKYTPDDLFSTKPKTVKGIPVSRLTNKERKDSISLENRSKKLNEYGDRSTNIMQRLVEERGESDSYATRLFPNLLNAKEKQRVYDDDYKKIIGSTRPTKKDSAEFNKPHHKSVTKKHVMSFPIEDKFFNYNQKQEFIKSEQKRDSTLHAEALARKKNILKKK
jgi:hypothetical protein